MTRNDEGPKQDLKAGELLAKVASNEPVSVALSITVSGVALRQYDDQQIYQAQKALEGRLSAEVDRLNAAKWRFMEASDSRTLERAAAVQREVMDDYVRAHISDFVRIAKELRDQTTLQRFWAEVERTRAIERGSEVNAANLARAWNQGLDEFYLAAVDERVRYIERIEEPAAAYERLARDIRMLWNREQWIDLRPKRY